MITIVQWADLLGAIFGTIAIPLGVVKLYLEIKYDSFDGRIW